MYTSRLEASVTQSIITQLENLNWVVKETDPRNNVTQQRAKTEEQKKLLRGKFPDFVLYQEGTNKPIGVIEAKKPGESLTKALDQATERYAKPLDAPLVFAYNDTYVTTRYLYNNRPLKIDGEDVRQFIDHYHSLRFIQDHSAEILSAPPVIQHSREQLIGIFKRAANLLREAGLTAGIERFSVFSDFLFLKIMDEISELRLHAGERTPIPDHIRWSHFAGMPAPTLHTYLKDVVWSAMNEKFGTVFGESLQIDSPEITAEIVGELSQLNLTAADTDVKGDAFEYFLKNAYQGLSIKDLGEYFTPRNIVRTMVSMVNPKFGEKIYDPFCGTGGFLIESFRYLRVRMKLDKALNRRLRSETIYGSEITSNARIAKMNMILFGDGHSNIRKEDSLAHPKRGEFDVVVTNPPYSQRSRYGNLYAVATTDADALCALHCFDSLAPNGRAALLVKEDFLSDKGAVGLVREHIFKNAKNFSVVSLPRRLFEPYTPTKTSIIYFEKYGTRNTTFFYVVKNVGRTLGARKRSIPQNDLPLMLDAFNHEKKSSEIDSAVVKNSAIEANNCGLWVHDYLEVVPPFPYPMEYLGKYIEEVHEPIYPARYPEQEFLILGVNNKIGVFENEVIVGKGSRQTYKRAYAGNLVYNVHRANVGSFGIVPPELDGGYVSGNYAVVRIDPAIPSHFVLALLKSNVYKRVVEAYDTKQGAVRANLSFEQLRRIKIPVLPEDKMQEFLDRLGELSRLEQEVQTQKQSVASYLMSLSGPDNGNGNGRAKQPAASTSKEDAPSAALLPNIAGQGDLDASFRALADQWYRETGFLSSTTKKAMHPAYQRIIAIGPAVIPLVFRELQARPSYWFWALNALTGADPARGQTTFRGTMEAWLSWGREQGYIQ